MIRNAIRRSRKIGLTQGGRVKNGRAAEKWSRVFSRATWEKLSEEHKGLRIHRENPSRDYMHPASPAQIQRVLDQLPSAITKNIRDIVLRRLPKEDEKNRMEAWRRFSCIILNAFPNDLRMVWKVKPSAKIRKHMERWCNKWSEQDGKWILQWTAEEIRRYYLYHLLLHEVGHINEPISSLKRNEDFAESFANEWADKLGERPHG